MARVPLTEEQKQVLRERLAIARTAKAAKTNTLKEPNMAMPTTLEEANEYNSKAYSASITPDVTANIADMAKQPDIKQGETISTDEYAELKRQIEELRSNQFTDLLKAFRNEPQNQQGNATVATGRLTGTFEKYAMAKDLYPNPSDRLAEEQRLQRFAFKINYELVYEVGVSEYETIDKIRTREPKFSLTLVRIMMDEDTGEPTAGRYEICRLIMHEDPEAALVIARDNNLVVEEETEEAFLNEMRYLRMRDWLLECFYPAPVKEQNNRKEIVIGGKLVTYYEKNNESGAGVTDWDKLPRIKF